MKADLITANATPETKEAVRQLAFEQRESVRVWAGRAIEKAVALSRKSAPRRRKN